MRRYNRREQEKIRNMYDNTTEKKSMACKIPPN